MLHIGRRAEIQSRKTLFFFKTPNNPQVPRYIAGGFKGKVLGYNFCTWIVPTLLKDGALNSLIPQLLICKVNYHTRDWIDRWRLIMWH